MFLDLVKRRRSTRRYTTREYPVEIYEEIMQAGLLAPTSFGHAAIELILVKDKERIRALGRCKSYGGSQINGADAVIVTLVNTAESRQCEFWIEDGAVASGYLLLAAEAHDIGACWVQIRNRMGQIHSADQEIRELLSIPDGYTVLNLIALGEKAEKKPPHTAKDINPHHIHYETF